MRWLGQAARMEEEKCIQNFRQKTEGMRQLWKPKHKCKYSIKMDHKGIGCETYSISSQAGSVW
jgi:hypothetical protein